MECHLCRLRFDARKHRFAENLSSQNDQSYRKRFCSAACLKRAQKGWQPSVCRNCDDYLPGEPVRSRNTVHELVFCSSDCLAVYRLRVNGIFPPDSAGARTDWRHSSNRVKVRDGDACQVCGVPRSQTILQVDHIVPYRLCKRDDTQNLLTLCTRCHGFKTHRIEPRLFLGRIGYFLIGLRQGGWPMGKVKAAMRLYDLPTQEQKRSMPWAWLPAYIRWPKPPHVQKKKYVLRMFAD